MLFSLNLQMSYRKKPFQKSIWSNFILDVYLTYKGLLAKKMAKDHYGTQMYFLIYFLIYICIFTMEDYYPEFQILMRFTVLFLLNNTQLFYLSVKVPLCTADDK